jgi:hypothetical protein
MALDIPRHGSTRATDGLYDPFLARIANRIQVRVDGRPVFFPIAYDMDRNWVRALMATRPRTGPPSLFLNRGVALEETLIGRVTVRWR